MNTRNRPERMQNRVQTAPVAMAMTSVPVTHALVTTWPQRPSFCPPGSHVDARGECVPDTAATGAHPLEMVVQNQKLAEYERTVRARFAAIVPVLKRISALQHEEDFVARGQAIAREEFGFELPGQVLDDAWVSGLDMKQLYGESVLSTFNRLADGLPMPLELDAEEARRTLQFFIECGFHEVDFSPCADGRLKGLLQYILRLPQVAVRRVQSYAGAMFDVESNVRHWVDTELRRYREGVPTLSDAGTRYLKVAVYHYSSSDPAHEGCAAHGSNELGAAEAALGKLKAFRTAIENQFCCGASVATLLIGVDTDTDSIKVHIPDAHGEMSLYRLVDNARLYEETAGMKADQARNHLLAAIDKAAAAGGWAQGNGAPEAGMRRLIARLLENNCSQIAYVRQEHGGRYRDIGHQERLICVGEGFDTLQLRNLTYLAQLYTVEEGANDLDVGIRIFTGLNIRHGLPVPIVIHYRYDADVPGARARAVERCRRIHEAIRSRYSRLAEQGMIACGLTVQAKKAGSPLEKVDIIEAVAGH